MIAHWHVAFLPAKRPTHCIAFGFDTQARVWVVINPGAFADRVQALTRDQFDRWIRLVAHRADILRPMPISKRPVLGLGFWCVGRVKKLLGFRSGALSPGGLRRDLLRHGASRPFALRTP